MKQKLMLLLACLLMGGAGLVMAQNADIKGIVTSSEDNEPVVGASVLVEGTTLGSITNIDGEFTIANVPSSAKTLRVTYVGMQTQSLPIIRGKVMHIKLNANAELLEEVVVTAMGISRSEKTLGYSATTVKSERHVRRTWLMPSPVKWPVYRSAPRRATRVLSVTSLSVVLVLSMVATSLFTLLMVYP